MISGNGSPSLSTTKWVPLASALTWLAFDRAVDVTELASHAEKLSQFERDRLLQMLSREWGGLADYAHEGSIQVRARPELGHIEVALGNEELRTHRHIGWVTSPHPMLVLDRFPVSFAGAFKARALGLCGAFFDPVASRSEVIKYKQVQSRAKRRYAFAQLTHAKTRAIELIKDVEPQTGLRDKMVATLVDEFAIPKSRAAEIWKQVTAGWPKHGRPKGAKTRQKIVR